MGAAVRFAFLAAGGLRDRRRNTVIALSHEIGCGISFEAAGHAEALASITYDAPHVARLDIGEDPRLVIRIRAPGLEPFIVRLGQASAGIFTHSRPALGDIHERSELH